MKNLLKPEFFYMVCNKFTAYLLIWAAVFLSYGIMAGLFIAPIDYQQQEAVRIMYIHVPCALLSISIYTIIGIMSLIYLIWKIKIADIIASVSAPFGAAVTLLALFSGSLWGKPMWGTWWVWDARLTSELILLFLYCGYMGLRAAVPNLQVAATVSGILAVVGLFDVPIIHYSVGWWNTLHQAPSISKFAKPSIDVAMLYPLCSVMIAMYLIYFTLICVNARTEILMRERNTSWIKSLCKNNFAI